jgi:hypothetical protein
VVPKIDDEAFSVVEGMGGGVFASVDGSSFDDFLVVMMFTCSVGLLRSEKEVRAHSRKSKAEASWTCQVLNSSIQFQFRNPSSLFSASYLFYNTVAIRFALGSSSSLSLFTR